MPTSIDVPRIVISGVASGVGKTTVAAGICRALADAGLDVRPFKVGPDFIDPSHLGVAAGRSCRNLDEFMMGAELLKACFSFGSRGCDVAVIEGVMGLYDGAGFGPRLDFSSTASVARLLKAPVVLIVDSSSLGSSVAPLVKGYADFDRSVEVAGVILNKVGSETHEKLLREALEQCGIRCLGAIPRADTVFVGSRHLGLVPAVEVGTAAEQVARQAGELVRRYVEVDSVLEAARRARPVCSATCWDPREVAASLSRKVAGSFESSDSIAADKPVVAMAQGKAFSFVYPENRELLEAFGAEVVPFDPMADETLPKGTTGVYLCGGFPELYSEELAENVLLREEIRSLAFDGAPVLGECGGFMYMGRSLEGRPMSGIFDFDFEMTGRLTLGYRTGRVFYDSILGKAGTAIVGHEFHYSAARPPAGPPDMPPPFALELGRPALSEHQGSPESCTPAQGAPRKFDGAVRLGSVGTYLHTHWASSPWVPQRLVAAAARFRAASQNAHGGNLRAKDGHG
jgi:cobyrinic acid a,c-diamide synthase